jgi:hypothetical protein
MQSEKIIQMNRVNHDGSTEPFLVSSFQYLYKPLAVDASGFTTKAAVLLMNLDTAASTLTFSFVDVPNMAPCGANVRFFLNAA